LNYHRTIGGEGVLARHAGEGELLDAVTASPRMPNQIVLEPA